MQQMFKLVFGAVIAYMLLLLYAITVTYMINQALGCGAASGCTTVSFTSGTVYVVTTIGGLVSALVIAKLAITKPGENPAIIQSAQAGVSSKQLLAANTLAVLYLAVWVIVGLSALVVGVMLRPEVNQTLSDIGTGWLGLAVASGYAYFGIDRA